MSKVRKDTYKIIYGSYFRKVEPLKEKKYVSKMCLVQTLKEPEVDCVFQEG